MPQKKKPHLKIKTSRYFTKDCSHCGQSFPNWFVSCPKCGAAWDEASAESVQDKALVESEKKNIKIVVKITEEDFDEKIERVQLIFSADHGKTWYQMQMDIKMDYFIAEIAEVPNGAIIIYYIEVYLINGEKVIENNSGKYYYYKVGIPITQIEQEQPPEEDAKELQDNISEIVPSPQDYTEAVTSPEDDITIFGSPQTQVDPDLQVCPNCNSKIKKMWSVCPICGSKID